MLRFFTHHRFERREWLRLSLGGLGLLGSRTALGAPAGAQGPGFGRARSVLVVFTSGGMSQIDTLDPKPEAPEEIRGAFTTIPTRVPGTRVCEHLPRLSRLLDRCTLVRSLSHEDLDHGSAFYLALTGNYHQRRSSNPLPRPGDLPTLGAMVQRVRPSADLPFSAVHVNGPAQVPEVVAPGQFAGLLGRSCEPLVLGDVTGGVAVGGLEPAPDLPPGRLRTRRDLLGSLEDWRHRAERNRALLDMDTTFHQAYAFLASDTGRRAFDLEREPAAVRARYGLHRSGQACLLGRRLVEAGVPYVGVIWNHTNRGQDRDTTDPDLWGWDTHNDIFEGLGVHLLPRFDRTFAALLEDLDQRGLLDTTLVICMGEFGRAPLVALEPGFAGARPGRKHWAGAYSILLAGAGIGRGGVVGASDRRGAYPRTRAYGPWDVAATVFHALGIDPAGHFRDQENRPYVLTTGRPILEAYG